MGRCRRCRATLLLALYLSCNVALVYRKIATLTPLNNYVDGAAVTVLHDTDVTSNSWQIESSGSTGPWAMQISLDPSWGFHASLASNISLRVNSDTPTNGDDLDPILAFSVNSAQYWSTRLSADESMYTAYTSRIGPQCDVNRPPLSTSRFYSGDVDAQVANATEKREEASGAWPGRSWQPRQSVAYFPLQITIENIPGDGVTYVYHSNDLFTQSCGFAEAFATESGLQIFIHVDDEGEFWSVQSFVVEYSYGEEEDDDDDEDDDTQDTTLTAIIGAAVFVCMLCVICVLVYKLYQKNRLERQVSDVQVKNERQRDNNCEPEPGQGRHDDDDDDDIAALQLEGSPFPARVFQPEGDQPELHQHEEPEESEEKSDSELLYDQNLNERPIATAQATRMDSIYKTPTTAGQTTRKESVDGDIVTTPAAGIDPNIGVHELHNADHM